MYSKKFILLIPIVVLSLIAGGCSTRNTASSAPIYTKAQTEFMQTSPEPSTSTPKPTQTVTVAPTPSAATDTRGDIPHGDLDFLLKYKYDDIATYNEIFTESTLSDLNGDGQKEKISLKGTGAQKGMQVRIGTTELTLKADPGWNFGDAEALISGTILDLDKDDGKKELLIETQKDNTGDVDPVQGSLLITLDGSQPKVLIKLDFLPEATGTGYITGITYSKQLAGDYAIAIQYFLHYIPGISFRETKSDITRAVNYTSIPPEDGDGYPTVWEQPVADKPGGELIKTIKEGTIVYFGPFHIKGWIELHDAQGTTLGWLDLNKVNVDEYIGNTLQASCH